MELYVSMQALGKLPHCPGFSRNGDLRITIFWKTKLLSRLFNFQTALQISRTKWLQVEREEEFSFILLFGFFSPFGSTLFLVSVLGYTSRLLQCDGIALLVSLIPVLALIQQQNRLRLSSLHWFPKTPRESQGTVRDLLSTEQSSLQSCTRETP